MAARKRKVQDTVSSAERAKLMSIAAGMKRVRFEIYGPRGGLVARSFGYIVEVDKESLHIKLAND